MLAQIFKRKAIMLVAAVTMALLLLPASLTSADGEVTQLIGSDTTTSDQCGTMLAMEGETLLVGMPFDDDAGNSSGSVFAFRLTILARCTLDVELSFTEGNTLNMDFELSAVDPTTLHLWLVASTGAIQLFSAPSPAIPSLTPFSLPVPGFPNMGMIGVITFMTDAVDGMICFDAETVDTGTTPIALPSVEQLRELVPAPNGILPEN